MSKASCKISYVCDTSMKSMVWFMAFNATFNNTSVILWRSVLLEEETEKMIDLPQVTETLSHNVV